MTLHKLQDGVLLFRRHEATMHDPVQERKELDERICARIMEALLEFYPGHPWYIFSESARGYATIHLPLLMREDKYLLHLNKMDSGNWKRTIREAGGHLLERYKIPRTGFDAGAFLAAQARHAPFGASSIVPE